MSGITIKETNWRGKALLQLHDAERCVLFVLIASDRGMAGGFNIQPQRMVQREMECLEKKGVSCQLITAGRRPTEYFTFRGRTPVISLQGLRQMKAALDREKDRKDIALIDALLQTGTAIQG